MTFVGNHDVTRIASQIDDDRHHAHAIVLLLTLGGTPSVYYGDEFGLRAVKEARVGGDDAAVKQIRRDEPKVGRNDPCPCGSGKKYKKCHGANQ